MSGNAQGAGAPPRVGVESGTDSQSGTADWRGVAAEQASEVPEKIGIFLRARSRRLLGDLLRPHRRALWLAVLVVLAQNAASMAAPVLVGIGIDRGIPALRRGDATPLIVVVLALAGAAVADALLRYQFLMRVGRTGQTVLLELRRRVFSHFQRLSLSFHEKYTSGRVISRLTSDLDALQQLLDDGLDGLITALLSVLTIGVILLVLDLPLALVTMATFPLLWALSRWFRKHSAAAYRKTREAVAVVIVQIVETLGGIRAVQAFRREPRNDDIFAEVNEDYRVANERAWKLIAVFVPGVKLLGNVSMTGVLVYGAYRVMDGDIKLGVLTAFLLYLRRFFDPMQDIAMFYNSYPEEMSAVQGALLEPLGVALHALDLGHLKAGASVGVFGCGPIGLLLVQLARSVAAGPVIATDPLPHRRRAALHSGSDHSWDPSEAAALAGIHSVTGGLGVDVAFEV